MSILALLCVLSADPAWQWPIDPKWGVTAAFGEYRGLRFHMGLDFSTGGAEGMAVRPARSGKVFRVRAQEHGYGKAVYMEHENGYVTVYAHLAAFGPKISRAIKQLGYDPASSFGTLNLAEGLAPTDLLAYTGESGAGLPHFHFEVRKGENTPVNPLLLDFPPLPGKGGKAVLEGCYLTPLDTESEVNGGPVTFLAKMGGTVQARGRLGIKLPAYLAGPRGSRLGCRALRVTLNGEPLGSWQPERISFKQYRRGGLVHDQAFSGFGPTRYAYCFDDRAGLLPELPGFQQARELVIDKPGRLEVEVVNLAGRTQRFTLELDPSASLLPPRSTPPPPVQATSLHLLARGDQLYFSGDLKGTLVLPDKMMGLAPGEIKPFQPDAGKPAETVIWRTDAGTLKREVGALPRKAEFSYLIGPWRLRAKELGKLPPVSVFLEPVDQKIMSDVLSYHSPVLHFGRPGFPTVGLTVDFLPEGERPKNLGIYAWSFNKKRWRHWGSLAAGKSVDLDYLTPLVVAQDISPPTIQAPVYHTYFTGRRLVIPLRDKGAGIDWSTIEVSGKDGKLKAAYDSDRGWIILPEDERRGPWRVTVADKSGLRTTMDNLRPR